MVVIKLFLGAWIVMTICDYNIYKRPEKHLEISSIYVKKAASNSEVKIGTQMWMNKNLDVDKFRNGDHIPQAKTNDEWELASNNQKPAWCYYNNDPANGIKYGKLYNWYAVNDPRGLAPESWHIPSDEEWTVLTDYLGINNAGKKMKSKSGWNKNGNGTNESGFSGLPGGYCNDNGTFWYVGINGVWWSASEGSKSQAWGRVIGYDSDFVGRNYPLKGLGSSVRCVRD